MAALAVLVSSCASITAIEESSCNADELGRLQAMCLEHGGSFRGDTSAHGLEGCRAEADPSDVGGECVFEGSGNCKVVCDLGASEVEASTMVARCMESHAMDRASVKPRREQELQVGLRDVVFQFCDWPRRPYADPDGYWEIKVELDRNGPGEYTATGVDYADRFFADCDTLRFYYTFSTQGHSEALAPFVAEGKVVTLSGEVYDEEYGELEFYPERNETVVLHSGRYGLDDVECVD